MSKSSKKQEMSNAEFKKLMSEAQFEKGDVLALIIAALITIMPVVLTILLVFSAVLYFVFLR